MPLLELAVFALAAAVTAALTGLILVRARAHGHLDRPNARSSHTVPTPRGGGLAICVTCLAAAALSAASGGLPGAVAAALAASGLLVAAVGHVDDRRGLSARTRIAVHAAAAVAALALLGAGGAGQAILPQLHPAVAFALLATGIAWSTNLFNFMDGIDGIAASQGAFVAGASAVLIATGTGASGAALVLPLATAGACAGFLAWNRPPARIFMGDVGSGFLGCWLAVCAVWFHRSGTLSIWTSTILGSLFVADATATLLRRMARGDRWREAHRSHAYQQLARRFGSHARATGLLWLLNAVLVLPLALLSVAQPAAAPALTLASLAVFGALALLAGAGRREG